jgi:2-polyprenyl-3-methyl-5-hydroxy-6-metoxy-1,4-benzoquinol methylase
MTIYIWIITGLMKQRASAYEQNLRNIELLFEKNDNAFFLDLGCDDGLITKRMAINIETKNIYGIDVIDERLNLAEEKEIKIINGDLNKELPFKNDYFDVVHANQVIEHIYNTDLFISEIYRILKTNGYAIISTENLASWHNIFALFFGYTPFSLTNISNKTAAVGNPFDVHSGEDFIWEANTWQHQRVFTVIGLKHLFMLYNFKIESILTSGYYPLPNIISKLDKYHSAFMTFKIRK